MACIYGLYDFNGNLRYIGKANDPDKRLRNHMKRAQSSVDKSAFDHWLCSLGQYPFMAILERDCENWQEAERRHIREARSRGDGIFNISPGGNGNFLDKRDVPEGIKKVNAFLRRYASVMVNCDAHPGPWSEIIRKQIRGAKRSGSYDALNAKYLANFPKSLPA